MSESSDLRESDNRLAQLVRIFKKESQAVTIAAISLIAAVLAMLMALLSLSDAKHARILVEIQLAEQQRQIDEYQRKVEIYDVRYANWVAYMRARSVELPEEE